MPDTLSRALRDVVDGSADPVTVEEVLGLPVAVPRKRPRLPLLLAAAAVVLLAVVGGLVLAGQGDDGSTDSQITASTPTAPAVSVPDVETCLVRPMVGQERHPCPVSDEQASAMLDIPVNQPEGIPEGWTLFNHDVRWYLAEDYGLPHDLGDYNRSWFRDPSEAETGVPCTTQLPPVCPGDHVQVTIRVALPDDATLDGVADAPRIERHAPGVRSQWIDWVADGRYYRLRTYGLDDATVLTIANSLA